MLRIIKKTKRPKFLVITPLKPGDDISKLTRKSVKNNSTQFDWVAYSGENNIPKNTQIALDVYEKSIGSIDYLIKIDSHTVWKNKTLDKMYNALISSYPNVGYVYCSFEFKDEQNCPVASFVNINFNADRLRHSNYISSNSMIKKSALDDCPFITDDKYVRLLDYAHWLSMLKKGYVGKLSDGYFYSEMKQSNISSGSQEDYQLKLSRVHSDFL
jgi:hypothetical protein